MPPFGDMDSRKLFVNGEPATGVDSFELVEVTAAPGVGMSAKALGQLSELYRDAVQREIDVARRVWKALRPIVEAQHARYTYAPWSDQLRRERRRKLRPARVTRGTAAPIRRGRR